MDPKLCANGCGFYSCSETYNLCSKCYKDHILNLTKSSVKEITELTSSLSLTDDQNTTASKTSEINNSETAHQQSEKKSNRYPEEHSCTVNFKQIGREILTKQNPLIKADKLDKIL
ncbi:zinc finger A20 and AN1 domain-containing stress-associated protein 9-like [Senna tora]|uniref:Zinc finger A20 and AN1 domain-containing stress-associated protein 9-like n=1 Tax=Senna tora TaxID=362788 RepID=A0A834WY52_9FABA|nr:zinc finger A20 and AN1 domain-containing stress-associated protein 9-like [Senna tora]